MSYICPKNPSHQSADNDYCSICGAKIAGAVQHSSSQGGASNMNMTFGSSTAGNAASDAPCPDCGTTRRNAAKFCEICRYNFEDGVSGVGNPVLTPAAIVPIAEPILVVEASGGAQSAKPNAPPNLYEAATTAGAPLMKWEVVIVVDPALYTEIEPGVDCPLNEPERTFPLDFADNLMGRRSDKRDIHPEIPLNDPGVSHRHAKLQRQTDSTFALLDVGSTNGTRLNGRELRAGVKEELADGDSITVGLWTRITVRKT